MTKWVYAFDEVTGLDKVQLGGKGANLADMMQTGLPVPHGFTLTTNACHTFRDSQGLTSDMLQQIDNAIEALESVTGKQFGSAENPLLVSVRSGAPVSMPGMMDTVLNLGLNDKTVVGLSIRTDNPRFAYDCYRRFIQMFGNVVQGIPSYLFERILDSIKSEMGYLNDQDVGVDGWKKVIAAYQKLVKRETGYPFPQEPHSQLIAAICAVFKSWDNQRAIVYRKVNRIPDSLGTAVNVQSMVFGNMGEDSGTGVAFTRNPSTGEAGVFGEYLTNAQGEDVVAGIRTPKPIRELEQEMPIIFEQFLKVCTKLEHHYQDVQDIEFTVERGTLYLLQTRTAKRTAGAAVRIAVELANEGLIDKSTAVLRVDPVQLDQLLHTRIDETTVQHVLAKGLPASPGAASGRITFTADDAERLAREGKEVLLLRSETTPEDIHGILAAKGILTSRGGMTSHAAVVARGMGKPCVCGCDALLIKEKERTCIVGDHVLHEGDLLTVDGATGRVIAGEVKRIEPELSSEFQTLLGWADEVRTLGVRANADNPPDAVRARQFGAEGIGLCRTEHMFMAVNRIPIVQEMILATSLPEREQALQKLLPMQQDDFYGILLAMDNLPVTIRLLDPPLHEFLPNFEELVSKQAVLRTRLEYEPGNPLYKTKLKEVTGLLQKVKALHEQNPMLGHRGCRLGLTFPEIYQMQTRAIYLAAVQLVKEGYHPKPEVMIPLVGHVEELSRMRDLVEKTAYSVLQVAEVELPCTIGTMIEIPRAALTADEVADKADFFSFGTNDLTQTTFGFSRDDAEGKFLSPYIEQKVLPENPFAVLDVSGVGQLIQIARDKGRKTKPGLKLGICGEHGGEKNSIAFCHQNNLNYVSCSPYRIPLARLASAHAALNS
jgi:pyruvate, orthophosphate dikinase